MEVTGRLHCSDGNAQFDFNCLVKIFKERRFYDVILEVNHMEIAAHKVVLSVCSSYFYWKFSKEAPNGHLNRVRIPEVDYQTLSSIVDFFYTSKILITSENVECLLRAAYIFALIDLQEACRNFLRDVLVGTNCLKVMKLARKYQCEELLSDAVDCVVDYFENVIKSGDFLDISHDQIAHLIASDRANADEEDILGCVLAWVSKDRKNRQEHVFSLLKSIRFPLMPLTSVLTALENEAWIKADARYNLFLTDILKCYGLKGQVVFPKEPRIRNNCLIAVGRTDNGYLQLEIYDFHKKEWQLGLQTIGTKRFINEAPPTICGSNVYLVEGTVIHKIDLTNPLGTWTEKVESGKYAYLCHLICDNKRIYVIGGFSWHNVGFYDEVNGTWGEIPAMSSTRVRPGLGVLKGKLYSIGGRDDNDEYLRSVECYDPATNSWCNLPDMFHARSEPGVGALKDKLLIAGGYNDTDLKSVELFDPKDSSWKQLPDMKIARSSRPGVIVVNDFVYVVGGWNKDQKRLDSVEMYDLKANVWSMLENPMTIGIDMVAVTLVNRVELMRLLEANKV